MYRASRARTRAKSKSRRSSLAHTCVLAGGRAKQDGWFHCTDRMERGT
jgi:hypothetical protein